MNDVSASHPRVLAYDRVAENKRRARWLMALFGVVSLPAAAFLALYLTFFFAVVVGMVFGVLTVGGALSGDNWRVWAVAIPALAVVLALLTPVLILWRAAELVLRLSGARPLGEGEHPGLRRTVENLCIGAGLPAPRLYLIESRAANAFSTGMSPESSSLVVTSGLLALLERRELEGVAAHELTQIENYDTRVSTVLAGGVAFLRLPFTVVVSVLRALFRVHWVVGGFVLVYLGLPLLVSIPLAFAAGFAMMDDDPAQAAVLLITISIPVYALAVAPLVAEMIRAGVSRQQQFRADADAVLLARSAEPLATALVKMDAAGMAGLNAARSTAHLWTVEPIPDKPWWERFWPDYHPPLEERVGMLAQMGSGIPPDVLEGAADAGRMYRGEAPGVSVPPAPPTILAGASADGAEADEAAPPEAYRLTAPATVVYEAPDPNSPEIERLGAGALVTVHGREGDFLHVITPSDVFGYIGRLTPMTRYQVRS